MLTQRKNSIREIRLMKNEAAHVKSFKELPDSTKLTLRVYNNFVEKQGKHSETQEDALAGVAGQLAQRAKRAKKV